MPTKPRKAPPIASSASSENDAFLGYIIGYNVGFVTSRCPQKPLITLAEIWSLTSVSNPARGATFKNPRCRRNVGFLFLQWFQRLR